MTDANRAQFRKWLADMVAVATSPTGVMHRTMKHHYPAPDELVVEIGVRKKGKDTPPLATAKQLALSVLVGEPDRAVLSALCDCLIEMGHEYAVAVAEKAQAEERERCAMLIETARYTISPGVIGQEQIVALAQKIAVGLRSQ